MVKKNIFRWGFLGLIVICLTPLVVSAESYDELMEGYKRIAEEVSLEFNYVDFEESLDIMKENGASEWSVSEERIYDFLFRSEIKNYIEMPEDSGMDVMCYIEGNTYQDYSVSPMREYVAEEDSCKAVFYFWNEEVEPLSLEFDVEFNEVNGDKKYKKEALEIVKKITKNQYVIDMDSINHYTNYSKNVSTFFDGNNAIREFSLLKNAVEEYPEYTFEVGFEEIRRGNYFVGIEDGAVFIKRDGIIYGYSNSEYGAGGIYFVPLGTKKEDYERVLKDRIDKYLGTNNEVKLEEKYFEHGDGYIRHIVNASDVVLKALNMTIEEYYKKYNTSYEKECAKTDNDCNEWTDETRSAIAVPAYTLTLNGKEYEVGILEVDDETLNRVGLISTVDKKTGIILNSKSSNIPLDASLKVNGFELNEDEKEKLDKLGYSDVKAYNFSLYSHILDKYIREFNNGTDIYIPIDGSFDIDNVKIIYLSDDLETVEYYDVEKVSINGNKYLKFSTSHFSNYIIASGNIDNPDTYDGVLIWGVVLVVAVVGICVTLFYSKKIKN